MKYTLKRSARARTLRLAVYPDGAVVVTAPEYFGLRAIERFLARHSEWVRRKVEVTKGRRVIKIARADIVTLKKKAAALARERGGFFAQRYGVVFNKISIRAQKTRWGSCSHAGNLSFNYRIAALPAHLADYVIIHEICHLRELNHSKRFWALVAQAAPDHRSLRKELRDIVIKFV